MSSIYFQTQLPWSSSEQENRLFSKITYACLIIAVVFAMVVNWVQLPEQTREEKETLPPQLARILKPKTLPPPPEVKPKPQPKVEQPKEAIKPKPQQPVKTVQPAVKKPKPVPVEKTKEEKVAEARENAKQTGLLAFSDDLASMRSDINLANVANTKTIEGAGEQEQTSRKRIGKQIATSTSGSLKDASISQNIGAKGELEGRRTTEFTAPEEGAASLAAKRIEVESQVIGNRDIEQIRKVLDGNKGAVYALYRRALRLNPDLEGKVTVSLTIEPNGSLSSVVLVNSELEDESLENKLLARIRMINFGAADVAQTKLEYAFNFLPF